MTNSVIVADSSPLIALAVIDQLDLLPNLYKRVLIPPAVWDEVTVKGIRMPGAQSVSQVQWLEIESPSVENVSALSILVDRGEAEALALAQSIPDSIILLDDAQARRVAERLGIPRIGTLGILRRAKKANLIHEIKGYIQLLRINGIYIHDSLIKAILRDVGEL
jgi:predicted nucleic acid-binding protein